METRSLSIAPVRFTLSPAERAQYREEIIPIAAQARQHLVIVKGIRSQVDLLEAQEQQAIGMVRTVNLPDTGRMSPMAGILSQFRETRGQLLQQPEYIQALEDHRLATNDVIVAVNRWRLRKAVDEGKVEPLSVGVVDLTPQIQWLVQRGTFQEPLSPPLPHNDLAQLRIFRESRVPFYVENEVERDAKKRSMDSRVLADLAITIFDMLPRHLIKNRSLLDSRSSSPKLRNDVLEGLMSVAELITAHSQGKLNIPSGSELGLLSSEQPQKIREYLQIALASCLATELSTPLNENQLRKLYQSFTDSIRDVAIWVGHDRFKDVVENMDEVSAGLMVGRISMQTYTLLDFPYDSLLSEKRLAELIRNSAFSPLRDRGPLSDQLLEMVGDRLEDGHFDLGTFLNTLGDIYYGKTVLRRLFNAGSEDSQWILVNLIERSSHFSDLRNEFLKRLGEIEEEED